MQNLYRLSLVAVGLVLFSAVTRSQSADTIADVRCVAVGIGLARKTSALENSTGMMLTLYYIERLDGRTQRINLEDLLIDEISRMTPADYESEAKRSGMGLAEKGRQITSIGKDMAERAH